MSKRLRIVIFLVSVCILSLALSVPCLAYNTYGAVGNITLNGITYYDIYNGATTSRSDLTNQVQFLRDVVTNDGNLNRWLVLGHEVLKQSGDTENLENYVSDCQTNEGC